MAHFPVSGGGAGVDSIVLFRLTPATPRTASGIRAKRYLETHGNGPMLIGYSVELAVCAARRFRSLREVPGARAVQVAGAHFPDPPTGPCDSCHVKPGPSASRTVSGFTYSRQWVILPPRNSTIPT